MRPRAGATTTGRHVTQNGVQWRPSQQRSLNAIWMFRSPSSSVTDQRSPASLAAELCDLGVRAHRRHLDAQAERVDLCTPSAVDEEVTAVLCAETMPATPEPADPQPLGSGSMVTPGPMSSNHRTCWVNQRAECFQLINDDKPSGTTVPDVATFAKTRSLPFARTRSRAAGQFRSSRKCTRSYG